MGQWIKGSFFSAKNYLSPDSTCQKIIKSSVYKATDNIAEGYKPSTGGNGVLYSWKNKPLAYHGVPTLNNMIFSERLWNMIHENPFIKSAMDSHCWWGEDQHRDDSEVKFENVALRINDFHCDDDNIVLGDIDLMDTPKGLIIYALAKTGAVGTSSRGFGDLDDIGNGLQNVREETYLAVDWDAVGFPAVPNCLSLYTSDENKETALAQSVIDLEKGLRDQISSAIIDAYNKEPTNSWISFMYNALNLNEKQAKVFPIASSLKTAFKGNYLASSVASKAFKK